MHQSCGTRTSILDVSWVSMLFEKFFHFLCISIAACFQEFIVELPGFFCCNFTLFFLLHYMHLKCELLNERVRLIVPCWLLSKPQSKNSSTPGF